MPDLLPGSTIEVRMPSVPRVQVEQPTGASTSVYVPMAGWRAALARMGQAVSTDDTYDLPAPTGVGLEFVITAEGLDDITWDGVSL